MAAVSLPADVVRAQLARILASEIFSRSDRLTTFLTFIVEQSLDGRGVELKEHVLAMAVYGKTADFDAYYRLEGIRNGGVFLVSPLGGTLSDCQSTWHDQTTPVDELPG
jgi:hypothetical protein